MNLTILTNNKLNTFLIGTFAFVVSVMFYYAGHNIVSSLILIITSFILVYINKKEYGYYTNPVSIFSGIWFLTIGLSTLRFHSVQAEWKIMTWICILVAFIFFLLGYYSKKLNFLKTFFQKNQNNNFDNNKKANLILITIVFFSSLIAVTIECFFCDIPLFSKDIYSYMNFGIFGIRYFGVLCALVLPLSCIYISKFKKEISKKEYIFLIIMNIIMFFIPFLILSRGLILTTLFCAMFCLCSMYKKKELIIIPIILLIAIFLWITVGRFKDDAYLDKAFQMNILEQKEEQYNENLYNQNNKNKQSFAIKNVKLMGTYVYACLNYDNFDLNVNEVKYTYGKSSLYPIYIITGLKFITHKKMNDPVDKLRRVMYTYNTYSIMFLPYMDFGIFGIAVFMFIMGVLSLFFETIYKDLLFSAFVKYCLLFSFFMPLFIYTPTFLLYMLFLIIVKKILLFIMDKFSKQDKNFYENFNE